MKCPECNSELSAFRNLFKISLFIMCHNCGAELEHKNRFVFSSILGLLIFTSLKLSENISDNILSIHDIYFYLFTIVLFVVLSYLSFCLWWKITPLELDVYNWQTRLKK